MNIVTKCFTFLLLVLSISFISSCKDDEDTPRVVSPNVTSSNIIETSPNSVLVINGRDLDYVTQVTLNGNVLAIINQNLEELQVNMPESASSGTLTIEFEDYEIIERYIKIMDDDFYTLDISLGVASKLDFINDDIAFAYENSTILKSTDGGSSWQEIYNSVFTSPDNPFFAYDGQNLILPLAGPNDIAITTDGGVTWEEEQVFPVNHNLTDIHYLTADKIVATTYNSDDENGYIFISNDHGHSWTEVYSTSSSDFINSEIVYMLPEIPNNNDDIYLVDPENFLLLKSEDGGSTWDELSIEFNLNPNQTPAIHFINGEMGFAYSVPRINEITPGFYKTINGGVSWAFVHQPNLSEVGEIVVSLLFSNENKGIAVTSNGGYMITEDGGNSWKLFYLQAESPEFVDLTMNSGFFYTNKLIRKGF